MLAAGTSPAAKGATTTTISGANLAAPIEITDATIVQRFQVWAGPGVFHGRGGVTTEETEGFIIDWSSMVKERPSGSHVTNLFYVTDNRFAEARLQELAYVVLYEHDSASEHDYAIGNGDEWYEMNTRNMTHGREEHWFRATTGGRASREPSSHGLQTVRQTPPYQPNPLRHGSPRLMLAVLVMKAEFKPALAGNTEQLPFVQANVVDANLELKQYGAGKDVLTNAGNPAQFIPFSAWTGMTSGPFALTFRHKTNSLDLSGLPKIRCATKTSGFHGVRPVIKLADGGMFIGHVASENVAMMVVT